MFPSVCLVLSCQLCTDEGCGQAEVIVGPAEAWFSLLGERSMIL